MIDLRKPQSTTAATMFLRLTQPPLQLMHRKRLMMQRGSTRTKKRRSGVRSKLLTFAASGRSYPRLIYLLYPAKYFAARDCAPAPNTLAAALLRSSFRNKDFASFFSFSDTSA